MRTHALSIRPACATFATDPDGALAEFRARGFHVEPDVWSMEERDALLRAARAIRPQMNGGRGSIARPHRLHAAFLGAMRRRRLVIMMRDLVAGHVRGLEGHLFLNHPGAEGLPARQESFSIQAPRDAVATAWVPFEDMSSDSGGLYVFAGSHAEGTLPVEIVGEPAAGVDALVQRAIVPACYARIDLRVPAGAVVLLHGHVVHGWNANRSGEARPSLLLTYVRAGVRAGLCRPSERSEIQVEE